MKKIPLPALLLFLAAPSLLAQHPHRPNWQNLDLQHDTVFGISTERAYRELLANKHATTVIVAVIDGGVDTTHEDLQPILWTNPGEVPGNGLDDDHNGYVDDIHGWNFIGGAHGNVLYDSKEFVRIVHRDSARFASYTTTTIPAAEKKAFAIYQAAFHSYDSMLVDTRNWYHSDTIWLKYFDSLARSSGKDSLNIADFQALTPTDSIEKKADEWAIKRLQHIPGFGKLIKAQQGLIELDQRLLSIDVNENFDPRRTIIGDDYDNDHQRDYGISDVTGPDPLHGTHVSGIIGAVRGNGIGIDGVADHVRIMCVRAIPQGDERDKDVGNAIRYAAANGAKVINISFGKHFSWHKQAVDEAVKYAMQKDVLIVAAAGNDGQYVDAPAHTLLPNKWYADSSGDASAGTNGVAAAWITVGASDQFDDSTLVASFSNYGKPFVDVFAPGVQLYSCLPASTYGYESGTSMAAPVVTGLAALIREYYPKLTAIQVKDIIMRSVVKPTHTVNVQDGKTTKKVLLSDICTSSGIVNAYNALKLAATY